MGPDAATIAHVTRVERSSRRRGASAAADGCRRHATSGAPARACPRRELPTEGPSFDTDERRRARGSSARAPTRVGRRAPRGSVTTTRGCRGTFTFCFSSSLGFGAGREKNQSTRGGRGRGHKLRAREGFIRIMSLAFRTKKKASRICARGKTSTSRPPRLRTRGAATPGSPCARRRSCRRTTWAWCRSSRRRGWCSRPWGSSSAAL
jgi:hypothetical protein